MLRDKLTDRAALVMDLSAAQQSIDRAKIDWYRNDIDGSSTHALSMDLRDPHIAQHNLVQE